ncbi:TIGR04500 family putative peptide maturation system protein [Streptomyces sp. WSLK1-3]|uniref:TIGR04500 family putative peptide maturation system protein n=1 Tax=Streptomyces sp. WSLK1-3 TaxID=3375475 RepID=UPI003799A8F6
MSTVSAELLTDAVRFLTDVTSERLGPEAAGSGLQALRDRHPGARLRLVRHREDFDESLHHDLLITEPGKGTVSLSWCPQTALPWPLRGAQRASENLLLRVNGVGLSVEEAVAHLDIVWDEARLMERMVTSCLLRQQLQETPVPITTRDLQTAMDAFRRARGLLTADTTRRWMAERCLSHSAFEKMVAEQAAVAALRKKVTEGRVEPWFAEHRDELDLARLAVVTVADSGTAQQLAEAVRGGTDFYRIAEQAFAAGGAAADGPLFTVVRRGQLPPDAAAAVFAAVPGGAPVGPLELEEGFALVRVLALRRADLGQEATVRFVEDLFFREWVAGLRRAARVEWFWGDADVTAPVTDMHAATRRRGTP